MSSVISFFCFLEQNTLPYCLVLVDSSNGFKCDIHMQIFLVHNQTKINQNNLKRITGSQVLRVNMYIWFSMS